MLKNQGKAQLEQQQPPYLPSLPKPMVLAQTVPSQAFGTRETKAREVDGPTTKQREVKKWPQSSLTSQNLSWKTLTLKQNSWE